jgi:16S rRNA (cytosine967-C5)-methyltransferase
MSEANTAVATSGAPARAGAARAVGLVIGHGLTLEAALADGEVGTFAEGARAHVQALAYGTVRYAVRLRAALESLLARPWASQPVEAQALLLLGGYQLVYADVPPHAAVSTVVAAARLLGLGRGTGFINAVLRRFARERAACLARADRHESGRTAHPAWLVAALRHELGERASAVLEANNVPPPLWLRANARRTDREQLATLLEGQGHKLSFCPFAPSAIRLEQPLDVRTLPAFVAGLCSVQDAAAQLAPALLAVGPGMRVLDACAAPGGKACHLLELEPALAELVALDRDADRALRIGENLRRLGLAATVRVGDARRPADWWDGVPFERLLVDAPCSGTGVIRRHPDIKLLRRASDLPALAREQARLLEALWPLLARGGRAVYGTCSVLRAENEAVVSAFLAATRDAVDVTESARLAVPGLHPSATGGPGFALLPGGADTDGFYYACFEKA